MVGAELIGIIAVVGTTISSILVTLFHSRCKTVRMCWGCADCERDIIHGEEEAVIAEPAVSPRVVQN